jgi:hypothetical protein
MGHDQRRTVDAGDDRGDREGLSRAGDSQQDLMLLAVTKPSNHGIDGGGLISLRLVLRN